MLAFLVGESVDLLAPQLQKTLEEQFEMEKRNLVEAVEGERSVHQRKLEDEKAAMLAELERARKEFEEYVHAEREKASQAAEQSSLRGSQLNALQVANSCKTIKRTHASQICMLT